MNKYMCIKGEMTVIVEGDVLAYSFNNDEMNRIIERNQEVVAVLPSTWAVIKNDDLGSSTEERLINLNCSICGKKTAHKHSKDIEECTVCGNVFIPWLDDK